MTTYPESMCRGLKSPKETAQILGTQTFTGILVDLIIDILWENIVFRLKKVQVFSDKDYKP